MHATVPLRRSIKARVTLSALAISLATLWSLSYLAGEMLREDMQRLLGEHQFSAVSVVAAQINGAVDSRLKVLESVAASTQQAMLTGPTAVQARLEQLTLLPTLFNRGVIIYRTDGTAIAEIPASARRVGVNYMSIDSVAIALKEGRANVSRPIIGKVLPAPTLGMTVPIRDTQGKVIGALSGLTNLAQPNFLDDVTSGAYGKTGGYMLVAPQHRMVVTATDRQRVMEKLPDPGSIALLDRFIQGYEGSGITLNPQGREVLASAKGVPAAGWYLAAALPTSEAYAPIREMRLRMLLATILLTLVACVLSWWMIRRQLAPLSAAARTLSTFTTDTGPALQRLHISRRDEIGQLLDSFNRLLATLAEREEAQRIAAVAFECQEGMIVTDARQRILRTNRSFSRIMGYSNEESAGRSTDFLYSDRHPPGFYAEAWHTAREQGVWSGEVWTRHKDGKVFLQWATCTAVRNESGSITNYVITHTDISYRKQQEAEQQASQLAQRDALVREVHHRIKNNLQGITGLLRQFAHNHPETADPINQAISQVRSIAVIHGLQGRTSLRTVRLCELTGAIANDIGSLWQVPVRVDIPSPWTPCIVAEAEAVPTALILNELIINAVKHGGQQADGVDIQLRKGDQADHITISISNTGQWQPLRPENVPAGSGLKLVDAMLPGTGVQLARAQVDGMIRVTLMLTPPVIRLEHSSPQVHEYTPDTQNPAVAG